MPRRPRFYWYGYNSSGGTQFFRQFELAEIELCLDNTHQAPALQIQAAYNDRGQVVLTVKPNAAFAAKHTFIINEDPA